MAVFLFWGGHHYQLYQQVGLTLVFIIFAGSIFICMIGSAPSWSIIRKWVGPSHFNYLLGQGVPSIFNHGLMVVPQLFPLLAESNSGCDSHHCWQHFLGTITGGPHLGFYPPETHYVFIIKITYTYSIIRCPLSSTAGQAKVILNHLIAIQQKLIQNCSHPLNRRTSTFTSVFGCTAIKLHCDI